MSLLVMWTVYAIFGVILYSLVFLWAVRTRQFSSEQRARRMPIEYPPAAPEVEPAVTGGRAAMAVPIALLAIGAAVIVAMLICTYVR